MFTFNGSAAKTVNVTKSAIGLGNVENTALSTWAGSTNLTTTKVGTLAAAAVKGVDTSISASSTSTNLPTSAAVASFVEGKGYVTSSGVTSVRVQATSPVVSSVNTAQSSTLNTTISLADGYGDTKNPYASKMKNYVLAAPSAANGVPTFRALVADDIPTLASSKVGLGNVTNNKQVKGLESGTTSGDLVTWGTDGYTVADSGIAKGSVTTKLTLAGTDYSASSNAITVTQANLQSAVQSTSLVLMTSAERTKLASIQVSDGGTIDFSGVTASAPLTATVSTDKKVNITHDTSGVTAGTYRSVTVNTYGHVTAGTNPTTLSGYGITDAKIANGVITLGSNTITPLTASSTLDATKLSGTASISTSGNAATADAFATAASVTLTGDTTGSASSTKGWSIATTTSLFTGAAESDTALTTAPGTGKIRYSYNVNKETEGLFSSSNNANSILTINRHAGNYHSQLGFSNNQSIYYRTVDGAALNNTTAWVRLVTSGNYTDYTVTKTGTGASGTWGISISGNADTATSATTATTATTAGKWTSAQTVYVTLGTASKTTTIQGGSSTAQTIGIDGTLGVAHGGTGATTFTANSVIMSGSTTTAALTTRAVTNNTSNTAITNSNTNIPTMNTIYYGLVGVNGASQTRATTIYAPTSVGSSGQYVKSTGSGAPSWQSPDTTPTANSGNLITSGAVATAIGNYVTLSTTQTISGAKTFSAATAFTNTTASTSKTTGGVTMSGGLGIAGQVSSNTSMIGDHVTMSYDTSLAALVFSFS